MISELTQKPGRTRAVLTALLVLPALLAGCTSPARGNRDRWCRDFEADRSGSPPVGWSEHSVGAGTTSWQVRSTGSGKVLAQCASDNPNRHFNVIVNDLVTAKNVALNVRFRAISGLHDQGGGFVWRYQDERNHYIVRANPLEDNVVLYKMENGVRTDLPLLDAGRTYGVKVTHLGNTWHTLGLRAVEDEFTVALDGRELFRVRDRTFDQPGRVGLWTKADAVTWFDDFRAENASR